MTSYTQRRHGVFHKKRHLTKRFKHTIRKSQRRVMRGGMKGTKIYEDGRRYAGDMKDGEANGTGRMTWPNGQVYVGEWKDGKRQGRGKFRFSNGIIYEGNWNNDSIQSLTYLLEDRYVSKIAFHPTEPLLLSVCGEETDSQPPTLFLQRFNQNTGVILDNICLSEVKGKGKGKGNGDTDESNIEINHISTIAFHPKKPIFAVGNSVIGEVWLFEWEIQNLRLSAKISSKTKIYTEIGVYKRKKSPAINVYSNPYELLIAFHPNQPLFATHGRVDDDVRSTSIWQINDESPYRLTNLNCEIRTTNLGSIAFHPTQPILMTASSSESDDDDEKYVILWNYFNYNPTNEIPNRITTLSRIPSEPSEPDHLSIRGFSNRAFNSDSTTFHTDSVTFVAFHPTDSSLFATCSKDAIIKIWRMAVPPVPTKPSYDKDGKELQITREDVMNATCMATCNPPTNYKSPVTCVAFHPTALLLVGGYSNGNAMLWELEAIVREKVLDTKPLKYQEYVMAVFPPPNIDIEDRDAYSSSNQQAIVSSVNFQVDSLGVTFLEIGRSNTTVVELQNVSHYVSDIKNREKTIFLDRKNIIKEISKQFMSHPGLRNPLKLTGIEVERAIQRLPLTPRGGDTVVFDPDWRRTLESRSQQGQISKDELDTEKEASKNWREKWEEANRLLQIRLQKEGELPSQPSKGGNTRRTKRKNLRK
jgi:WD40 repeat protein